MENVIELFLLTYEMKNTLALLIFLTCVGYLAILSLSIYRDGRK